MESATIRLEALDESHAEGLFAALDHEAVGRFIGGPDVTTLEALLARIDRGRSGPPQNREETWLNYAVLAHDVVVGRVEATLHDDIAEVAYVLGPAFWGRGYATAATAQLIGIVQLREVGTAWACVHPENTRSARVLTRLGFLQQPGGPPQPLLSYDPGDLVFSRPLSGRTVRP